MPVSKFIDDLLAWYNHLQPNSRKLKWDPMATFIPPIGALPNAPSEWSLVRKGGSNGVFLFLLALSWTPLYLSHPNDKQKVEALMKDLVWVLGVLSNSAYVDSQVKMGQHGGEKKKRKQPPDPLLARATKNRKGL